MTDENCNAPINTSIEQQLHNIALQLQKHNEDVNSLREEVRGNSVSVGNEVKKLKSDLDIEWKRKGNRIQYNFNCEVQEILKQLDWALKNNKTEYGSELVAEALEKIAQRQKLIRIADSSECGWETVNFYTANPLAADSEDESKLRKAENQALKRRKSKAVKRLQTPRKTPSASAHSGAMLDSFRNQCAATAPFPVYQPRDTGFFRGQSFQPTRPGVQGSCFSCGSFDHFRRQCPFTSGATAFDTKSGIQTPRK
jgi:hypothetical protein